MARATWVAAACSVAAVLSPAAEGSREISLRQARAIGTPAVWGGAEAAPEVIDGDASTFWSSGNLNLEDMPANLLLTLPEPAVIDRVVVETVRDENDLLRLTDFDLFGRLISPLEPYGWASLGGMRGGGDEALEVTFPPARIGQLRVRLLSTERAGNTWPRVRQVRVYRAEDDPEAHRLHPGPVVGESRSETLHILDALDRVEPLPATTFDHEKGFLHYVRSFFDTMIERGRDRYGSTHSPMFLSVLDLGTGEHPNVVLPTIPGQRQWDRALFGGNLQFDMQLIGTARYLADLTGEGRYLEAMVDYLRFFLDHCTGTPTGLWPWGDHVYWNFYTGEPDHGHSAPGGHHFYHEYSGAQPLEFWELAWELNPQAVLAEADGLINHITDLDTFDYNRHADIRRPLPEPRTGNPGALDFPRHGGFYLQVWAFAWSKTGDERYIDWIRRMMDQFDSRYDPKSGLLHYYSERSMRGLGRVTHGQTRSLALTMLESAPLLGGTEEGARCEAMALGFLKSALRAVPAPPAKAEFTLAYGGGGGFRATEGLHWALAHRLTGEEKYLDAAEAIARVYGEAGPPRTDGYGREELERYIRAGIYGDTIQLMLDMRELRGEDHWLEAARRYGRDAVEQLYFNGLFRGATNLWYYESELYVSTLIHALTRLHAAETGSVDAVPTSYFHR